MKNENPYDTPASLIGVATQTDRCKERILLWKSSDPTWQRYAVCHAWRTGPDYNTRWFETYEQAEAWADKLAAKVGGVVVAK